MFSPAQIEALTVPDTAPELFERLRVDGNDTFDALAEDIAHHGRSGRMPLQADTWPSVVQRIALVLAITGRTVADLEAAVTALKE